MKDEDGSDSLAVQLVDEKHWDELVIIIAVVCFIFLYFSMAIVCPKNVTLHLILEHRKRERLELLLMFILSFGFN